MEEINRFVVLAQSDRFTITELCEQFGISRKTGYKHLDRYATSGLKGLQPRSHRPHQFPQRTAADVEALILAERRLHRTWGPKKLHDVLAVKHGLASPPARSTIAELLRRHGLSVPRRRQPGVNFLDRGSQVQAMAEMQELFDFPPAPKLNGSAGWTPRRPPHRSCAARACSSARGNARRATPRPIIPTT